MDYFFYQALDDALIFNGRVRTETGVLRMKKDAMETLIVLTEVMKMTVSYKRGNIFIVTFSINCLILGITPRGMMMTNPGPTTSNKRVWIFDICYKQIHVSHLHR